MVDLRQALLEMGGLAEEALCVAVEALLDGEQMGAQRSSELDAEINRLEKAVDERCHKVLALHQPAASDLRFVTQALKFSTDLERVGDLASNVSRYALRLAAEEEPTTVAEMSDLASKVRQMLSSALDAFVDRDVDLAWEVLRRDDEVDALHWQMRAQLQTGMEQGRVPVARGLTLASIIKDLERIGDHATNIAEGVIFLVRGQDVRHAEDD